MGKGERWRGWETGKGKGERGARVGRRAEMPALVAPHDVNQRVVECVSFMIRTRGKGAEQWQLVVFGGHHNGSISGVSTCEHRRKRIQAGDSWTG